MWTDVILSVVTVIVVTVILFLNEDKIGDWQAEVMRG